MNRTSIHVLGLMLATLIFCSGHGLYADGDGAGGAWPPPALSAPLLHALTQDGAPEFMRSGEGQQAAAAGPDDRVQAAKASAAQWLRQVVAPVALPDDLGERLIPVQEAVSIPALAQEYPPGRFDAIFAQWEANGYVFHSLQLSGGLTLVITPGVSNRVEQPPGNDIEFVARVAPRCLAQPYLMLAATLSDTRTVDGVTRARANGRIVPPFSWAATASWYTDGRSVVFAGAKSTTGPMDPPVIPDWF